MKNLLRARPVRLPIVVLGLAAWLAISNHCALAAFEGASKIGVPSCHGMAQGDHSQPKNDSKGGVECCKILRATLPTQASSLVEAHALPFSPHYFPSAFIFAAEELRRPHLIEWDTGPPGLESFAVSVLQRSLLAHAPPFAA